MNYGPISCECSKCRAMCEACPCIPTPAEARQLVQFFPQRMATYVDRTDPENAVFYVAPIAKDAQAQIVNKGAGECTFYMGGKCELHYTKLKPAQGRLAHHDRPSADLRAFMLSLWKTDSLNSGA